MTTLDLLKQLIACPSITPDEAGCFDIIANFLSQQKFQFEYFPFNNVNNLYATYGQNPGPLLIFLGHVDVVPTGPLENWQSNPFIPTVRDGYLYGRGAADMKSGVAAFLTAAQRFTQHYPNFNGKIGILLTSDEEGPSIDGIKRVAEIFKQRSEKIDYCLVGEASSVDRLGDTIKVGRRGSLSGTLTIHGKQGHVAYPHLVCNPIHFMASVIAELTDITWDNGNDDMPATSLQFSNIHAGTGANNVVPGECHVTFNFRYSTAVTAEELQQRVEQILKNKKLQYTLNFTHGAWPFLSPKGLLLQTVNNVIFNTLNIRPEASTSGGTSDGRFIAPLGTEVIELGPINATIHQIDECIAVDDLNKLSVIYQKILEEIFKL